MPVRLEEVGRMKFWSIAVAAWFTLACAPAMHAQTTITGSSLSHRSTGSGSGNWTLSDNGYVGTYFTLANAGQVTLTVNASGATTDGVLPRMNLAVADT